MNSLISKKERGLLKGALRRVFSRSDLRRLVMDSAKIEHFDPSKPRVKKWIQCNICNKPSPQYKAAVDHVYPVVPVDKSLEVMSWDELINRIWCPRIYLQILCKVCHDEKTKQERKERTKFKKEQRDVRKND